MTRGWRIILTIVALLAVAWSVGRLAGDSLLSLVGEVGGAGVTASLVFVGIYVVATIAMIPGSLLTLAAGALFGILRGTILVFIGATVGASLAFLISRHLARPIVARRLGRDRRFDRIDAVVEREGARLVLLMRLTPVLPFNLLNYALGATRIRFRDYLLASIGMLPGTVLYVYSGSVIGEITAIAAGAPVQRGPASWMVLGLGLAATLLLVALVTRMARRAMREEDLLSEDASGDRHGRVGPFARDR